MKKLVLLPAMMAMEAEASNGDNIEAGDWVKSRSPGSKGKRGQVKSITGDNVKVSFDGQIQSIPLNHLELDVHEG